MNDALFCTITNANFDPESIYARIEKGLEIRDTFKYRVTNNKGIELPKLDVLDWHCAREQYDEKAQNVGILAESNEDIRSLKELTMYGLKGMAAYLEHAARLGQADDDANEFILQTLGQLVTCNDTDELTALTLKTGEWGVKAMALLDKANTTAYGNPEITEVNIGVGNRPGILISGHDLNDIEQLLEQSKDAGIDIYTHSEMLPAHYYPKLKKYSHLKGNYGNAWWKQREEFEAFNGPILFTTSLHYQQHGIPGLEAHPCRRQWQKGFFRNHRFGQNLQGSQGDRDGQDCGRLCPRAGLCPRRQSGGGREERCHPQVRGDGGL